MVQAGIKVFFFSIQQQHKYAKPEISILPWNILVRCNYVLTASSKPKAQNCQNFFLTTMSVRPIISP